MADVAPMAEWRPFWGKSTTPLIHDIICLHTMVGSLSGSWSWSNREGGSYWHFGCGGGGALWQCQDLRFKSAANLNGNWRVIPIETEDTNGAFFPVWGSSCGNVPWWTEAQMEKLVALVAWLCARYNIPPVLIPDTLPGRRGIAYHRQGIDPWRVSGGELWSKSDYKCCPDWRRIQQLVEALIPRVQARLGGTPPPAPKEWDEVATKAEIQEVVRAEVGRAMQKLMANRNNVAYNPADPDHAWLAAATTLPQVKAELADHIEGMVARSVQALMGRNNAVFDPAKYPWLEDSARLNDLEAKIDAILAKLP